jgi:hypothetical protein
MILQTLHLSADIMSADRCSETASTTAHAFSFQEFVGEFHAYPAPNGSS